MPFQFLQRRPARHLKADHFERTLRRRAARVNQNQQARDDRHVRLDFDSILLCAQQMAATQQLFEHPEKQFDQPPQTVCLCNEFGRNIEQICGQSQRATRTMVATTDPSTAVSVLPIGSNAP